MPFIRASLFELKVGTRRLLLPLAWVPPLGLDMDLRRLLLPLARLPPLGLDVGTD